MLSLFSPLLLSFFTPFSEFFYPFSWVFLPLLLSFFTPFPEFFYPFCWVFSPLFLSFFYPFCWVFLPFFLSFFTPFSEFFSDNFYKWMLLKQGQLSVIYHDAYQPNKHFQTKVFTNVIFTLQVGDIRTYNFPSINGKFQLNMNVLHLARYNSTWLRSEHHDLHLPLNL